MIARDYRRDGSIRLLDCRPYCFHREIDSASAVQQHRRRLRDNVRTRSRKTSRGAVIGARNSFEECMRNKHAILLEGPATTAENRTRAAGTHFDRSL
jgi:hypothetical protein